MTIALMNLDRKTNEKLDMSIAIISYHIFKKVTTTQTSNMMNMERDAMRL